MQFECFYNRHLLAMQPSHKAFLLSTCLASLDVDPQELPRLAALMRLIDELQKAGRI